MFYTKYRPQIFTEISQPNAAADALMNEVATNKLSHAYLFIGPRGTGKTTTARILAKAANCTDLQKNGDPCNKCPNCKAIQNGNFMDLIEIDAASNRGIDDIRDLKDKIKLAPSTGSKKVYIIDEVHMLTTEAFNALLKTLEEPPKNVVFVLCTTEAHKVPDTIKSRCQVFKFRRATIAQLVERLEAISKKEKAKISKEELKRIAEASLGGFRDSETLLQQVIEGNISTDSISMLGSRKDISNFIEFLTSCNAAAAIKQINDVLSEGLDLNVWSSELLKYLRDLLLVKANAHNDLVDTTEELMNTLQAQAQALDSNYIVRLLEVFIKAQNLIKSSFIPQLPLEMAVIEICGDDNNSEATGDLPEIPRPKATVQKNDSQPKVHIHIDEPSPPKKAANIDFTKIEQSWNQVLTKVHSLNNSIVALLKSGKAVGVEGDVIILEVFYAFHKERLENPKNRNMIETVLNEVFGQDLSIKCIVSENRPTKSDPREVGELTDYNVTLPAHSENALDIFDGGLPLK